MATTLKTKNSVTAASAPSSLAQGELAVNITDKKLWVGNAATTPVQLLGTGSDASFTNLAYTGTLTGGTGIVNLGSGQFYKDASGNVGLGTSSPRTQAMILGTGQVTSAITDAGGQGGSLTLAMNSSASNSGGALLFSALNDNATYVPQWAIKSLLTSGTGNGVGALAFSNRALSSDTSLTERMRIDSSGNVLIGTTTNTGKLVAALGGGHTFNTALNGTTLGSSNGVLISNYLNQTTRLAAINFAADSSTDGSLIFGTSSSSTLSERMRIDSSGNVGIGTSSPSQNLVISSASAGQTLVNIINTSSNYSWNIGVVGSSAGLAGAGSLVIRDSTNGENVITTAGVNRTIALQGATSTTGVGITFPATQNASSNVNTLDDYEEGTFTTTLTNCGSGIATLGTYVKIGNIVTARLTITGGTFILNSSRFNLPFTSVALQSGTFTIGTLKGGFIEAQSGSTECYFATTDSGTAYPTITYITS
jgi:hypothetical protein